MRRLWSRMQTCYNNKSCHLVHTPLAVSLDTILKRLLNLPLNEVIKSFFFPTGYTSSITRHGLTCYKVSDCFFVSLFFWGESRARYMHTPTILDVTDSSLDFYSGFYSWTVCLVVYNVSGKTCNQFDLHYHSVLGIYSVHPQHDSSFHLVCPCLCVTHSSDSRSFISLFLSRKQPRECMLSSTSGSMSSAEGSVRIATFRGTGCSGSGSFFPPLWANVQKWEREKSV